jgi:hypothetical protein
LKAIEPARLQALKTIATEAILGPSKTQDIASQDAYRIQIINDLFAFEGLGSDPTVAADAMLIDNGKSTEETILAAYLGNTFDAGATNTVWLNAIYAALTGSVPAPTDPTYTKYLNALNATPPATRQSIAQAVELSPAALGRMVSHLYTEYLDRLPSSIAGLDEVTPNVNILKQNASGKGRLTSYEQVIVNLLSSPEYLALQGNSNDGWVAAINAILAAAKSTGTGVTTSMVLGMYQSQRLAVTTAITGSLEYRNRVYINYFTQLLPSLTITTTDLATTEQIYQKNGQRLEAVEATILSGKPFDGLQYYPLSGQGSGNPGWLNTVYTLLLHRPVATAKTDPNYTLDQSRLSYLASHTQNAQTLQAARFFIAQQILNSTEYRGDLIASFFNNYLISNIPPTAANQMTLFALPFNSNPVTDANASLVTFYVQKMNAGMTQQQVIAQLLALTFTAVDTNGNQFDLNYLA